jgi:hypothetical protein
LDTPFIFIISRQPETDQAIIKQYPERAVYHYIQKDPYTFYLSPPPGETAPP